jgi:hypothetical protein
MKLCRILKEGTNAEDRRISAADWTQGTGAGSGAPSPSLEGQAPPLTGPPRGRLVVVGGVGDVHCSHQRAGESR